MLGVVKYLTLVKGFIYRDGFSALHENYYIDLLVAFPEILQLLSTNLTNEWNFIYVDIEGKNKNRTIKKSLLAISLMRTNNHLLC